MDIGYGRNSSFFADLFRISVGTFMNVNFCVVKHSLHVDLN